MKPPPSRSSPTGGSWRRETRQWAEATPTSHIARYMPDGTLDGTFNSTGSVLTDFGGFDVAYAVAIQSTGRIVAAGFSDVSGTSDFASLAISPALWTTDR